MGLEPRLSKTAGVMRSVRRLPAPLARKAAQLALRTYDPSRHGGNDPLALRESVSSIMASPRGRRRQSG